MEGLGGWGRGGGGGYLVIQKIVPFIINFGETVP